MITNNILKLQDILRQQQVIMTFSGRFSQGIIEELGDAVKNHLESEQLSTKNIYNVFSVFIEQAQNIRNYSVSKKDLKTHSLIANSGIVIIGKEELGYFICSGNIVEDEDIDDLKQKIEHIQAMDPEDLKKYYKELLKKDADPKAGGAGIGIVDMARKAKYPIEYQILQLEDNISFFVFKVIV